MQARSGRKDDFTSNFSDKTKIPVGALLSQNTRKSSFLPAEVQNNGKAE